MRAGSVFLGVKRVIIEEGRMLGRLPAVVL